MQDHRLRAGADAGYPDKQLYAVQRTVPAADRAGDVPVCRAWRRNRSSTLSDRLPAAGGLDDTGSERGAEPDGAARRAVGLRDGAAALSAAKAARGDRAVADGACGVRAGARGDGRGPGGRGDLGACEHPDRRQYAADVDGRSAGAGRLFFRDERRNAARVFAWLAGQRVGIPTARDDRGGRRCARRGRGDGLMAGGERLGLPDGAVRDSVLPVSLAVQHDSFDDS